MTEHRCPRCGGDLKIVTVQVPVYSHHKIEETGEIHTSRELRGYEEREEVSDCPRCTGGY